MKTPKKEVLIGLCAVVALAVLYFGIEFLKGVNIFKPANYYYASYTNVAGLQKSAPVTLNGFKVGQVREITYEYDNPGHVRVELSLDRELRLPLGSKAVIEQDLLGTSTVALHMSQSKDFHDVGNRLEGETAQGLMGAVSDQLMPSVSAIFPKIDSLVTALNTLVRDPALAQSVKRLDDITLSLSQTMRKLDATAGQLSPVMTNVNSITGNVNTITADLSQVSGKLAAMPVDSLMNNLMVVSTNLRALSEELDNPESTLGALTHDRALYNNLNAAAASLDSLLIDVKKNPKRYISIKLL
ncbi:MAG: MlaD family protein [[Clostridium] fimetarium]|nr:MlaD family protein [Alistipes timonensis]MCM1405508.1 MlaD family protein [[Clostridium] fimetarium]